jgi:hypothetical protein
MECPYCGIVFSLDGVPTHNSFPGFGGGQDPFSRVVTDPGHRRFSITSHSCPTCNGQIMWLNDITADEETGEREISSTTLLYPKFRTALLQDAVPETYRQEFQEAHGTLTISPKASAALSRRCLQRVIRDLEGISHRSLFEEIDVLLKRNTLPRYLAEDLDSIRQIGNFAAHPVIERESGEIIEVEPGEAEWNLQVLRALLEFYFVDRARSEERRAALNEKLRRAGKGPMLGPP